MKKLDLTLTAVVCLIVFYITFVCGCRMPEQFDGPSIESYIRVTRALSTANNVSTPMNPFALPIGIGLAGITAMLEALRRKERSGRKNAEQKLNNDNNNK